MFVYGEINEQSVSNPHPRVLIVAWILVNLSRLKSVSRELKSHELTT